MSKTYSYKRTYAKKHKKKSSKSYSSSYKTKHRSANKAEIKYLSFDKDDVVFTGATT